MDEMKITSGFMSAVASKAIKRLIKKKYGRSVNVKLNELRISFGEDGAAAVHLNADASLEKGELIGLLKAAGLD